MRAPALLGEVNAMRLPWIALAGLALFTVSRAFASECPPSKLSPPEAAARAQGLERKAQGEFQRQQFAEAARDLQEAACLAPAVARLHYELGAVEAAGDNLAGARAALQKADRLEPNNMLPLAMLVRVNLAAGEIEKVKEGLRTAAKRFGGNGKLHAQLARELAEHQQYDLALAESLRAERSGDTDPEAAIALAALENTAGAYEDAVRHATAIEQETQLPGPVRASAAGIAGLSCDSLGRQEEAARHLQLAIELAPSQETSYLSLAKVLQEMRKYKEAAAALEQGRKQLPDSPAVLLALGSNLVAAEECPRAAAVLTDLIRRFPDQFEAYRQLAEAYRKMGQEKAATATMRQLSQRKPDYPMLHVMIAQSLLAESPVDEAAVLRELAAGEKVAPNDADIFYLRGKTYATLQRYPEAVTALRRATELRPTDPSPYYQLGLAYQKLGQTALAKQQFERMEHVKIPPPVIASRPAVQDH
ncbi:MAG TPA: tetratricopeptide repeat protein [Bryobacterales bacterium]|nr:tetratricopeptide repeat protein [Bryobacterales bacterium]